MTFEELMAIIEKMDGGEEKVALVTARISKPNNEAQSLRKRLKESEDKLKKHTKKYDVLKSSIEDSGIDLDGDVGTQINDLSKTSDKDKETSSKQEKEILKLTKAFGDMEAKNTELEKSRKQNVIREKLAKSFNDKIYNPEVTLDYRIKGNTFFLDENENVVFKNSKGEEIVEDVFDAYCKQNTGEVKVAHKLGPGGSPLSDGSGNQFKNNKEFLESLSDKELLAMPDEKFAELSRD